MGEYAKYNGQEIKIGTCEQMYYLRADQVARIEPVANSVNPRSKKEAETIRFRFPFPQEDGIAPGAFSDPDYGLGVWGVEPPEDVEHHSIQLSSTMQRGLLVSLPCPESKEGKASPVKVSYNGYCGKVQIHSQRLVGCQLVLVCKCGSCRTLWRVPTLEDAHPILVACEQQDKDRDGYAEYWVEIERRIIAGYRDPNFWSTV